MNEVSINDVPSRLELTAEMKRLIEEAAPRIANPQDLEDALLAVAMENAAKKIREFAARSMLELWGLKFVRVDALPANEGFLISVDNDGVVDWKKSVRIVFEP